MCRNAYSSLLGNLILCTINFNFHMSTYLTELLACRWGFGYETLLNNYLSWKAGMSFACTFFKHTSGNTKPFCFFRLSCWETKKGNSLKQLPIRTTTWVYYQGTTNNLPEYIANIFSKRTALERQFNLIPEIACYGFVFWWPSRKRLLLWQPHTPYIVTAEFFFYLYDFSNTWLLSELFVSPPFPKIMWRTMNLKPFEHVTPISGLWLVSVPRDYSHC